MVLCWSTTASAEFPLLKRRDPLKADTSRAARNEAEESIPYQQLAPAARAKVDMVLAGSPIFRRLPVQVVPSDPDMYLFLVEHPDVIVNIWRVFGVGQIVVRQISPNKFEVTEENGTRGTFEFLYGSHDTHVIYAEGDCVSPLLAKPIHGRSLVVLKSAYIRETNGRTYVTSRMDAFVQIDRAGAELVTKTLQPVVGRVADINFAQTAKFFSSVSRTAKTNPSGVTELAAKLDEVQPPVRQRFAQLAQEVAAKAPRDVTGTEPIRMAEQPRNFGAH